MFPAEAARPIGLATRQFQILRAKLYNYRVVQCVGNGPTDLLAGVVGTKNDIDSIKARAGLCSLLSRQNELRVQFRKLLIIDEPSASSNDIVFGFELYHVFFSERG